MMHECQVGWKMLTSTDIVSISTAAGQPATLPNNTLYSADRVTYMNVCDNLK